MAHDSTTDWLARRLSSGPPLILDGAIGTELERRGHETGRPPWSARALEEAPRALREIHADYARAGAEILTANTFRTQRHHLERAGVEARASELTARAVELAREGGEAALAERVVVAGSVSPLEDCYRPELVADDDTLRSGHRAHVENLLRAGVDLLLVETQIHPREIEAASVAAADSGLPWLLSVLPVAGRTLSGDPLAPVLSAALERGAAAILLNCLPPSRVARELAALPELPTYFGVYPNLGAPSEPLGQQRSEDLAPDAFAEAAREWLSQRVRIIGGCCGTGPAHIAALSRGLGGR